MACKPEILKGIPLFALLDEDETAVLASQVELRHFAAREPIYKKGSPGGQAYVMISGKVRVSTIDEDQQEVVIDEPAMGQFFGFASMLEQIPHQTSALALEATSCLEVSRDDIAVLLQRKPLAGMDLLTTLSRQFHASQQLVRLRATRNPNEVIDAEMTFGERIADSVASFGGSWSFIIFVRRYADCLHRDQHLPGQEGLGSLSLHPAQPVPFHAGCNSGAGDHDEPESPGHQGSSAR